MAELAKRPQLSAGVILSALPEGGFVAKIPGKNTRYVRLSGILGRFLADLDGTKTPGQIAESLGPPWTDELVGAALSSATTQGLVGAEHTASSPSRWRFLPPLTVQFTVVHHADRLVDKLVIPLRHVGVARCVRISLVIITLGIAGLVVQLSALLDVIRQPISPSVLLAIIILSLIGTCIHELAHGVTLRYYGARPARMGVMLLYLMPAFFCDVSDGWLLPQRKHRVHVACAGIGIQAVLAAVAALVALPVSLLSTAWQHGLLLLSLATFAFCLINAVPFAKLDGYIALMSALDAPNLRHRSMTEARSALSRLAFGGTRYEYPLPQYRWAAAFGVGCAVLPAAIVVLALSHWRAAVSNTGYLGAALMACLLAYLLLIALGSLRRAVRGALAAGASRLRIAIVIGGVLAAVSAVLLSTHVTYSVSGYYRVIDGHAYFVTTSAADRDRLVAGQSVRLRANGLLLHDATGAGELTSDIREHPTVTLSDITPISGLDALNIPAYAVRIAGALPAEPTGLAFADTGSMTTGGWLLHSFLAPSRAITN